MTVLGRIRAISLAVAVAALGLLDATAAQTPGYMRLSSGDILSNRPVYLGINKSVVIDLPRAAGDVLVSNPQIADAVLRTSTRLYLIGVQLGQASVFLFDSGGAEIASFDIYVEADLGVLNQLLAEAIPNGYVRAEAIQGSIVLRGQVPSATDASRAVDIASRMVPALLASSTDSTAGPGGTVSSSTTEYDTSSGGPGIVNFLTITGEDQVALKVTMAEVQREVVKQLGINIMGTLNDGDGLTFGTIAQGLSPIPINPVAGGVAFDFLSGNDSISGTLRALDETNMVRTLAEPTLTAVSGETADFLAGGEFPFLVDQGNDDPPTVEFKEFGVQLAFTPVVLSEGRISLKLRSEVSEIVDFIENVPVLSTRRTETTVELPSGGAFVVGGLIQQRTRTAARGFPGLQKLPILGALFSSKNFLDNETELVMIVTPYLVKPVSPRALARPDENFFPAHDAETYFLNRLTKVFGTAATVPVGGNSAATVGFTFD
jgi:pilus assembly protein CpaC